MNSTMKHSYRIGGDEPAKMTQEMAWKMAQERANRTGRDVEIRKYRDATRPLPQSLYIDGCTHLSVVHPADYSTNCPKCGHTRCGIQPERGIRRALPRRKMDTR